MLAPMPCTVGDLVISGRPDMTAVHLNLISCCLFGDPDVVNMRSFGFKVLSTI